MHNELKADILGNLHRLEKKLTGSMDDKNINTAYGYALKIKNGLLAAHQDKHFGLPQEISAALLTNCNGYVTENGIAVLSIGETLPHSKELTGTVVSHWQSCVHASVGVLANRYEVPRFEKALVGIHIAMPRGVNNSRVWDSSNRTINLVLNNLKGVFFPDDDIEHMAFAVVGSWADGPMTKIVIGSFDVHATQVLELIKTV